MKVDLEQDDVFEKYIEATGRRAGRHGAWGMVAEGLEIAIRTGV
jgi:hypothetical protein